jgi:hypothetical protein
MTNYLYVGSNTAVGMKSTNFWDKTPCRQLNNAVTRFGGTHRIHLEGSKACHNAFTLVSCSAYSSKLKMDAICSYEKQVDSTDYTALYIPGDKCYSNTNLIY